MFAKENTMNKRKMKKEQIVISLYDLDGSLQHARDYIDILIDEYGKDANLDNCTEYEYGGGEYSVFNLHYERAETDAEMDKRLKAAEKAKVRRKAQKIKDDAAKEVKERKEFVRLQKLYGE
jgi:hypothetical protein